MVVPVTGSPLAVHSVTHPIEPLTPESIDQATKQAVAAAQKVDEQNAKLPHRLALAEEQELEQLERRFQGFHSVEHTQAAWQQVLDAHQETINNLKREQGVLAKLLESPLPQYEAARIAKAIQRYEDMIQTAIEARRVTVKKFGASVNSAKELTKLRPRLLELRTKARAVAEASRLAREALKSGGPMVLGATVREGRRSY